MTIARLWDWKSRSQVKVKAYGRGIVAMQSVWPWSWSSIEDSLFLVATIHRLHAVHRCDLLLQMSHVAWSVCLSVGHMAFSLIKIWRSELTCNGQHLAASPPYVSCAASDAASRRPFFSLWLLHWSSAVWIIVTVWLTRHPYPTTSVSSKCHSKAHLQSETMRPHQWCAY